MKLLLTNIFPKKCQSTLGLPPPGGGGEGDSAEGTQNFQKGRQAPPPPWGEGIQATKKRLALAASGKVPFIPRTGFADSRRPCCLYPPPTPLRKHRPGSGSRTKSAQTRGPRVWTSPC